MTSCNSTGFVETSSATSIAADEARYMHGRAGVEFVDPRPAEAIAATTGKIAGARLISIDEINSDTRPPAFTDRSIHVVTTCHAGPMVAKAADAFARLGFAKVS